MFSRKIKDYQEKSLIGNGSFGRVYKCYCITNQKMCAIKKISKRCLNQKEASSPNSAKIRSEISVHSRLQHENIVQFHGWFDDVNYVYLILELCPFGSLNQLLKKLSSEASKRSESQSSKGEYCRPVMEFNQIRAIVKQICHALSYIKANGIVHRDLNLNNILISWLPHPRSEDIRIKIADFGLAYTRSGPLQEKNSDPMQPLGTTICGTPGFISPEVWQQTSKVSSASDLFSLGSIIYSLVTGIIPKGDLDLTKIPPIVSDLIERLLAHEPANRLTLDKLVIHPFLSGEIQIERLTPLVRESNNMKFSLAQESVEVYFKRNQCAIRVDPKSKEVIIIGRKGTKRAHQLERLPPCHWKKYMIAARFVELVKSKTPKITIYCEENSKVKSIDGNGNQCTILKGSFMENRNFEVAVKDHSNNSINKIRVNRSDSNDPKSPLDLQAENLYQYCLKLDCYLSELEHSSGIKSFPVSLGPRFQSTNKKTDQTTTFHLSSIASSRLCKSVTIPGIGLAMQSADGIITLSFEDGSAIAVSEDSNITFSPKQGIRKRFERDEPLPDNVINKLQHVPRAIEHLRRQSSMSLVE